MTKKELQERELKLEAVIHAYKLTIDDFLEKFPMSMPSTNKLEELSRVLFNSAGVRVDIEDYVNFELKYE